MDTNATHYVYQFWNATGELIYVGITNNLSRRVDEHRRTKPWFSSVNSRPLVVLTKNRKKALKLEKSMIRRQRPAANIAEVFKGELTTLWCSKE